MTQPANINTNLRRRVNPRVLLILAGLAAAISGSVILTDHLSPRPRDPSGGVSNTSPDKGNPR